MVCGKVHYYYAQSPFFTKLATVFIYLFESVWTHGFRFSAVGFLLSSILGNLFWWLNCLRLPNGNSDSCSLPTSCGWCPCWAMSLSESPPHPSCALGLCAGQSSHVKDFPTLMGLCISWQPPLSRGCPPQPTLSDTLCQTTHSHSTLHTRAEFRHPMLNSPAMQMPCFPRSGSNTPHWKSRLVAALLIPLGLGH